MKAGLLEKIQSRGYWRINIRPISPLESRLTFQDCRLLVERANVTLRGWDYPHVSTRNDESGGSGNGEDYAENWTDWWNHFEFWRQYRSGQFLHYRNLWEDWQQPESGRKPPPKALNVIGCIYFITEVVEFLVRLGREPIFSPGLALSITLFATIDRELWIDEVRRAPFFEPKRAGANKIEINRRFDWLRVPETAGPTAQDILTELFDYFGWNPPPDQIRADQDRLYSRQM